MVFVWVGGIQGRREIETPFSPLGPSRVDKTHKTEKVENRETTQQLKQIYDYAEPPPREPALLVEQIMVRKLYALAPDDDLETARKLLMDNHIHHAPVVDGSRLTGMVSDRDLLRASGMEGTVAEVMSSPVLTALIGTPIREIAGTMVNQNIHCLPIINNEDRVQGLVTASDILRCIVNQAPLDLWT